MEIETREFEAQHYIYIAGSAPMMDAAAIAKAMGAGFGQAYGFLQQNGITPLSAPMTVYTEMPGADMTFRSGFVVAAEDAAKASGDIKADQLPKGSALHAIHTGPYSDLNKTHGAIWGHAKAQGLSNVMPVWEIYIDDPEETAPEALRTEVYHALTP
ncbi:MAG: GyrI-like domain-containing protein [Cognatishimia sp.]